VDFDGHTVIGETQAFNETKNGYSIICDNGTVKKTTLAWFSKQAGR